jgi:hypothetical protein
VEALLRALEPYRHLDPPGWIGVYTLVPPAFGLVAMALGILLLLRGGRRLFRLVAAPLGALIAALGTPVLAGRLGYPALPATVVPALAIALGLCGLLFPPLVVFLAFGIPAGLLAGQLAGPADWLLGFAPGLLAGGALGVALHRVVGALLSAAGGAWVTVLGAMALVAPTVPSVSALAAAPAVVFTIAGCLALGGAVYQLAVRASPEAQARARKQRALQQRRGDAPEALDQRWSKYGKKA